MYNNEYAISEAQRRTITPTAVRYLYYLHEMLLPITIDVIIIILVFANTSLK